MKQIFIVLLVAAVGIGVYYYFNKKQNLSSRNSRELILGKWRVDSLQLSKDDTITDLERTSITLGNDYSTFNYSFDSTGIVVKQIKDSLKVDTGYYKWVKADELAWTRTEKDPVMKPLRVIKLDSVSMILRSADNGEVSFKRLK